MDTPEVMGSGSSWAWGPPGHRMGSGARRRHGGGQPPALPQPRGARGPPPEPGERGSVGKVSRTGTGLQVGLSPVVTKAVGAPARVASLWLQDSSSDDRQGPLRGQARHSQVLEGPRRPRTARSLAESGLGSAFGGVRVGPGASGFTLQW